MDRITSTDEMLKKAFQLAYFIHGDRGIAVRIVSEAMAKLDVAATAQGKRLYYKPTGRALLRRSSAEQFRSKVTFSELHLLQRLIYIESESYEKQKEQASNGAAVRKEDLLVYFIKHLVRITLKRNSFYVTLGMSRLLYNYTTTETMRIYNVVVQDPERVKDDYYYRSRKGVLMQEIKERFGDIVRICHGQRGEERFQAEPEPGQFAELVEVCLSFFTPWATPCFVPAGYDPITQSIPSLVFHGEDAEDRTEVNRIHAALHPNCYQRLIGALGLHSPAQRLEVPQFFLSRENGDRNDGYRGRGSNLELGAEDLNTIKNDLDELTRRRRRATAGLLRVVVDGVEHARLDVKRAPRVRFNLDGQREMIEVWTADETGALLLASYLFTHPELGEPHTRKSSVALGGGHNLSIVVSDSGDASGQVVEVGYQLPGPLKARAARFWQFVTTSAVSLGFAGTRGRSEEKPSRVLIPVSALILLLIFAVSTATYLRRRANETNSSPVHASVSQESGPVENSTRDTNASVSSNAIPPDSAQRPLPVGQSDVQVSRETQPAPSISSEIVRKNAANTGASVSQVPDRQAAAPETISSEEEVTRALRTPENQISLLDVRTVFLEISESDAFSQTLREALVKRLQQSNRLSLTQDRAEADALLRLSVGRGASKSSAFSVQLINAQGQVIWPLKRRPFYGIDSGTPEQISAQILKELLNDIEQLRRRRR